MINPLRITAAGEAATGVALILFPQLVVELLFGVTEAGAGLAMSRITGMALLGLGLACWPDTGGRDGPGGARTALLVYSALATIYLAVVGLAGELRGPALWPAVVVHLVVTVLVARRTSEWSV